MGEIWTKRLTKADREKVEENWTMTYEINGRRYKFENVYLDGGVPYGYCRKTRMWAWLFRSSISPYGKDIEGIPAIRIDSNKGE